MKKRNLIERMEAEGVLCAEGFLFDNGNLKKKEAEGVLLPKAF